MAQDENDQLKFLLKRTEEENENLHRLKESALIARDAYNFKASFIEGYRKAWDNQDTTIFIPELIDFFDDPAYGPTPLQNPVIRDILKGIFNLRNMDADPPEWRLWGSQDDKEMGFSPGIPIGIPAGSRLANCSVKSCERQHICHGLVGGDVICPDCYPIWYEGVKSEREDWEEWTESSYTDMYHHHRG